MLLCVIALFVYVAFRCVVILHNIAHTFRPL